MVGLPWEQHVTFLDDRGRATLDRASACARRCGPARATRRSSATRSATRSRPRSSAGTAATGSSASSSGSTDAAKDEDPDALVTYVNYPSTEYLQLPFIDLVCFNVFLESGPQFESYLAAAPEHRRRPPAARHRDRPRLPPQQRGGPGARARLAGPHRLRRRLRGHVRVLLDRRVVPRRLRHRRLGLRPRRPRPRSPSRRSRRSAQAFSETAVPAPTPTGPAISVVVCAYNSEDTLRELLRRAARARLSRLRGDRRQRRLDRPHRRDRRASTASA